VRCNSELSRYNNIERCVRQRIYYTIKNILVNGGNMKSEKKILIAFLLNMSFSVFEFIGGIVTGSCAISSDAIHDLIDASSIGLSYFLEKKSRKKPDEKYTYGYGRYSLIGSIILTTMLIIGSLFMIFNAVRRIINPSEINYNGMIAFAIVGVLVNFFSALFTRHGDSLNQKAVNIHMLEDVFGWIIVLVGAIVIKFTNFYIIDPLLSVLVSIFILVSSVDNMKETIEIFLEKTPCNVDIREIIKAISENDEIIDVHHIHVWSIDGNNNFATMHIVTESGTFSIKNEIKEKLKRFGIFHSTLEFEHPCEQCSEKNCVLECRKEFHHHKHK